MTPFALYDHSFGFGFRIKIGAEMERRCFLLFHSNFSAIIDDFIDDDAVSGVVLRGIVQSERFKTLYDSR